MTTRIETLRARIEALQDELEEAIAQRREDLRWRVENGRVVFEARARARHAELRQRIATFVANAPPRHLLTAPVIYSLIVPFAIADLWVTLYQAICFPAYGIPKVRRRDYIRLDRHQLAYLNGIQKLNCIYCGYVNGLIAYIGEIAARTEAYWCPIKHSMRLKGRHRHYAGFMEFGDGEGYADGLRQSRSRITGAE
ncbi:hypothetical protein ATO6_00665 [Oceanicola sp. 22II-s10i]|uniref:hypothetical protein n=1 Tax=Oceanicola sp. 22II-s10i TaxID=1317116 RepID=UPI000B5286D0|nr:hypothetical protein [Oceanicola sp. 22II-s10i]OWU85496.1 hypothetical protein ATO6_00665 [Oceanicola sp. 22II-s10i]